MIWALIQGNKRHVEQVTNQHYTNLLVSTAILSSFSLRRKYPLTCKFYLQHACLSQKHLFLLFWADKERFLI
uniref:Uncharacterized protein n=1 Tax=Populus trichocarpa TaxID=3694 RepID=A0A2K1Y3H4_POPTR